MPVSPPDKLTFPAEVAGGAVAPEHVALLAGLLDHAPAHVFLQDLDGRFLFVNPAMLADIRAALGPAGADLTADSVLGRRIDEILPEAGAQRLRALERRALAQRQPLRVETRAPGPGGEERVLRATLVPMLDAEGRPYALCGMADDVTAHRKTRDLLVVAAVATRAFAFDWNVVTGRIRRPPEVLAAFGIDPVELGNQAGEWLARVHPDDRSRLMAAYAALTPEHDTVSVTYRFDMADGTRATLRDTGRGYFDRAGRLMRVCGMSQDIREEAAVAEALRESEMSLAIALEAAEAGVWELDLEGGGGTWSDSFCRMLGYQPGEVAATFANWFARVHPDDRAAVAARMARVRETREISRWDLRLQWPDGSEHWLRSHGREIAGDPGRLRGVSIDITDLRRAQDEVGALNAQLEQRVHDRTAALETEVAERRRARAANARLAAIVESTSELVAVASMGDGVLVYANRALRDAVGRDLTGLPMAEVLARTHPPAEARRVADEAIPHAVREGRWRGTNTLRRADGVEIPVLQDLFVTRADGDDAVELSCIMRDASDQVRVEQALRERAQALASLNAELARAARMKDEFLANMSHELRTPLNAVLGIAEALGEEVYGPLDARQREALATVEQSGRQLLGVINDVLDLARIEAGKLTLDLAPVSVNTSCQASLRMVTAAARAKEVGLSFHPDGEAPTLAADGRRLIQVLVNLLVNAVKFTPAGGHVRLLVRADRAAGLVALCVEDDGIGIAPADLERIFEPFAQLEAGLDRRFGGSGLGLNIVRRLVELHGGTVRVESEVGRGSRFTVSLPWREAEPVADAAPAAGGAMAGEPFVLLVDDNQISATVAADFLAARGCRVRVTGSGAEALRVSQAEPPALVLMDIQMPGMDGFEAMRALRALPGLQDVPVIALTALAMPGDRERCLDAGATDYLSKPVSLTTLLERVRALL